MTFRKSLVITIFAITLLVLIGAGIGGWLWLTTDQPQIESPYVTQLDSPVRGLSAQEVDDLLNGRGAGYARSAELNSYPGPRHVLDMAAEIDLSPEVQAQTEAVFVDMQAEAQRLGHEIVRREAQLSEGFAQSTLSETDMKAAVQELGQLYGDLRATHLQAHFQIRPFLTQEQIVAYNQLRGYGDAESGPMLHDQHQH